MVKITRINHPIGLTYIQDKLTILEGEDVQTRLQMFQSALKDNPDGCFFAYMLNATDDGVDGFVLAVRTGSATILIDSFFETVLERKDCDLLLLRLLLWSDVNGSKSLQLDSRRNSEELIKRINAQILYYIAEVNVSNLTDQLVIETRKKPEPNVEKIGDEPLGVEEEKKEE